MTITNHSQNKPNQRISHLGTQKATRDATRFLRFPRNRNPIIYLVRHVVIGQLFLPNMFLFRASLVSLVLLQQEEIHRLNLVSKSKKTNLSFSILSIRKVRLRCMKRRGLIKILKKMKRGGFSQYHVSQDNDIKHSLKALQKLTR